ncbi:MAG TPA: Zn-dependent hydrolase [Acidisphaera sp.]|nr:Zn-dependent hydrolase [Acidisphaera sp.]
MTVANLRVDADRLWDTLMETARFGGTKAGGINRLTLTDEDAAVRAWFRAAAEAAGCSVTVDVLGNMFARRPGRDASLPPIAIGSHLDTQPTGGKFDGVLGVLAGLEVLRTLNDRGIETNAPIEVVNWTNEEGSRFAPGMIASAAFAGAVTTDYVLGLRDRQGKTFGDELARIGWRGDAPVGGRPLSAHFELHIEQGPILEDEGKTIGIVTGIQALRWFDVTVTGRESHAGSTPMPLRRDALAATAEMVLAIEQLATREPPGVATVGVIESRPNSRNVIPGSVDFTIDLRHPDDAAVERLEEQIRGTLDDIAARRGVAVAVERIMANAAVRFDPACIDAVRQAAAARGYAAREITSGASHDSASIAAVAPTTMIFVPSEGGLSHNEAEHTSKPDCAAGADVLLHAVLAYDERLGERAAA